MTTTSLGIPKYAQTDNADIASKLNAIADAVNALLAAPLTGWKAYTPVLTLGDTGATVSGVSPFGRYMVIGKTVLCNGTIGANAATTGHGAAVSLPFTAKERLLNCGSLRVTGPTVPSTQNGIARMAADQARLVVISDTNGFLDVVSGASLQWSAIFEIA